MTGHDHVPTRPRALPYPLGRAGWVEIEHHPSHTLQHPYPTAWALRPCDGAAQTTVAPLAVVEILAPGTVRFQYRSPGALGRGYLHEGERPTVEQAMARVLRDLRSFVVQGARWHALSDLRRDPSLSLRLWPLVPS